MIHYGSRTARRLFLGWIALTCRWLSSQAFLLPPSSSSSPSSSHSSWYTTGRSSSWAVVFSQPPAPEDGYAPQPQPQYPDDSDPPTTDSSWYPTTPQSSAQSWNTIPQPPPPPGALAWPSDPYRAPQQQQQQQQQPPQAQSQPLHNHGPWGGASSPQQQDAATLLQGGSRRSFPQGLTSSDSGRRVELSSSDRYTPLVADVNLWNGPNDAPAQMKLFSEDGNARPWKAHVGGMGHTHHPYGTLSGTTLDVRNAGPMEFPLAASFSSTTRGRAPPQSSQSQQPSPQPSPFGLGHPNYDSSTMRSSTDGSHIGRQPLNTNLYGMDPHAPPLDTRNAKTILGGDLKYFTIPSDTRYTQVYIEVFSEGLPVQASVELLQGPETVKQRGDVYLDNGRYKPFSAWLELPTPGYPCTVYIRNTGPMEYPLYARVTPIQGTPRQVTPPPPQLPLHVQFGGV